MEAVSSRCAAQLADLQSESLSGVRKRGMLLLHRKKCILTSLVCAVVACADIANMWPLLCGHLIMNMADNRPTSEGWQVPVTRLLVIAGMVLRSNFGKERM